MSAVRTSTSPKTATMQALVLTGPHDFEIRQDVPIPHPGPNEVLARVRAIAICGTDAEIVEGTFKGRWPRAYPFIPGHEWAGEVVEAGEVATAYGFSPGTRVAGTSHSGCGYCRMCRTGRYNLCLNYGREDLGHRQYRHYTQAARVGEMTGGLGADVAVESAGTKASVRQAIGMVRKGGRVAVSGIPKEPSSVDFQKIVVEEIDLYGVRATRNTMEEVIPLIADGRIPAAKLITHHFKLSQFAEALRTFNERIDGALKVIVEP